MIKSFASVETEQLFERERSRKIPYLIHKVAFRKLLMIHAALQIQDLLIPPGNHLEKLKGNKKDLYSIRINDQWRISFRWQEGNAYDVQILDYH